jgi:recombination associated protein RdgC
MWHKNATVFGIRAKQLNLSLISSNTFSPCGTADLASSGWAPVFEGVPHYQHGMQVLLHFMQEKKHIPKSAVEVVLAEKVAALEESQGFAPGKKAMKELRERVVDELLPRALATRRQTRVWLDMQNGMVVIDSTSQPVIDEITKTLVRQFEHLGLGDFDLPGAKVVTSWLIEEPADFTLDDEVTLQYPGASGKLVKYTKANLSEDDVQRHVQMANASVESMAMTYAGRLSFVLSSSGHLRRIKALDVLKESLSSAKNADAFQSDFALMTLEMQGLLKALQAAA